MNLDTILVILQLIGNNYPFKDVFNIIKPKTRK